MLSCKKRPSLSARKPRQSANLPTQRPVVGSQSLQLRSCFLTMRDPQHTRTHKRELVCVPKPATHTFMDTGLFRVSSRKQDNKNTPPSFDSFVNLLPRQHPSHKDCQTLPVTTQTKPSAFRHERRWCEASTTHSHACEQASRARLRRHFSNLMRYPSYAQRTSTTLPACGKLQFLKTQSRRRALFTRAPPPPRRQDVSPRHA